MQRTHWSYQSLEKIGKPEEDSSKANAKIDKNYKCERNALRRKMTETTDKPKVMSERALKTRAKIMDATRAFIVRSSRSSKNPARAKVLFFITLKTVKHFSVP